MTRIAICDDEKTMLDMIYDKVVDICTNNDIESMIDVFLDPRDLKKKCRIVLYDLVFLDISMTPIDGLEIAEYLNTYYTDTKIVFVTHYDGVVYETFRYSPISFIRKSSFDEDMDRDINGILRKLKLEENCVNLVTGDVTSKTKISDICYVESSRNDIHIYLKDGKMICTRKTFRSFTEELNSDIVIQINRGVMVNLSYVKKVNRREIVLDNDRILSISRTQYEYFKDKFFKYYGEH